MTCYRIATTKGDVDYVSAVSLSQAIASGNQLFPGATLHVREATTIEQATLLAAHSYDGEGLADV